MFYQINSLTHNRNVYNDRTNVSDVTYAACGVAAEVVA